MNLNEKLNSIILALQKSEQDLDYFSRLLKNKKESELKFSIDDEIFNTSTVIHIQKNALIDIYNILHKKNIKL